MNSAGPGPAAAKRGIFDMTRHAQQEAAPRPDAPKKPAHDDLTVARRVLAQEVAGLEALAKALGPSFIAALDRIEAVPGRVVVTGIGKSGHIGRKIAATMASTGTPALFVHAGEASHGDLGMITREDAVMALSNSGDTPELSDIIAYTRRFAIPLIALTSRADSALARQADVTLLLPRAEEACPMGLAPTTSTTLMIAMGDAVAVALLERKGFTVTGFRDLHPGGQLGKRLLSVADLMHASTELPLVMPQTRMAEVLLEMTAKHFGCVGVTDPSGRLIGIITDGDLRRHMSRDLLEATAESVMTAHPRTIRPNVLAVEAVRIMNGDDQERPITVLFVVDEDRPIGILHIHDCLRAGVV
jgi:arabinose-5-phosphate isomerase